MSNSSIMLTLVSSLTRMHTHGTMTHSRQNPPPSRSPPSWSSSSCPSSSSPEKWLVCWQSCSPEVPTDHFMWSQLAPSSSPSLSLSILNSFSSLHLFLFIMSSLSITILSLSRVPSEVSSGMGFLNSRFSFFPPSPLIIFRGEIFTPSPSSGPPSRSSSPSSCSLSSLHSFHPLFLARAFSFLSSLALVLSSTVPLSDCNSFLMSSFSVLSLCLCRISFLLSQWYLFSSM